MKYPKEYLEEIKLRLKVSQVVGKYVQLKSVVKNLLTFTFKMKKLHLLRLAMKKDFTIVLVPENMEIFLIF